MQSQLTFLSRFLIGVTAGGMLVAAGAVQPALAQYADQPAPAQKAEEPKATEESEATEEEVAQEPIEEIVVKGFRSALEYSVGLKREAVNTRESIVADDIGKMPDLNLAEAIQRVPAVTIQRAGGEGRQISLRGLGSEFTRVTLNGMEVPSSGNGLDSAGGVNRGRSFDFNVFAAELFNRIDINKSPTAAIEEGGVAGSVELYTAHPLDNPGTRGTITTQMGYNDLSEKMDPRITGQLSWSNKAKTAGLLVSGAYTGRKPFQDGFGTVRWTQPKLDGSFGGNNTTLSNDTLNSLWFPRLPRQDSFHWEQERLGIASALEFRPNDKLDVNVSWLYSHFQSDSDSYNSFAEFRTSKPWGFSTITANSVTVDDTGKVALAGNFDNVGLRTESRLMKDTTNFNHVVANLKYDVSDNFKISGMVGYAKSAFFGDYFRTNIETKTDKGSNFSYDFTENSDIAKINYALDVTNPDNFVVLSNENFLNNYVDRTNKTARFDLAWTLDSDKKHTVRIGGIYNNREVDSRDFREDKNPPDVPLSSITRVYSYVDVGNYGGETELDFLVMDHEKGKAAYNYGSNMELNKGVGRSTWTVTEKTAGVYADYNLNTKVSDHGLRANLGARYVNTKAEVLGYLSSTIPLNEDNSYGNLLPSVNIAFDATEKLVLRAGASRSMTRPGLSSLVPIKQYSDVNFTVSGGNSQLDPLKADALDLSAEYYFTDKSVLAVGYFYKNIKSFIASSRSESVLREEDIAALPLVYPEQPGLLDPTKIWTYNTTTNVDGTKLSGIEVAYQQAFTFLPGALKNLGFAGNYSYVNAETETTRGGQIVKVPLTDLSKNSWNATLYYEVPKFGVRVSVNSRDSYVTNNQGGNGNVSENTSGMTQVDMSAFYHINDMFTLALEGINLNDAFERLYVTGDGTLDLYREGSYSGRQLFLGLRANF